MDGLGPLASKRIEYDLRGFNPPASGGPHFVKSITAAGGSPTVAAVNLGGVKLTLDATNEIQVLTLSLGDILPFAINKLQRVAFHIEASDSFDASVSAAFGVASAMNADLDAIAAAAMFKAAGSNAIVAETDDGVINTDDVVTGLSIGSTPGWFGINLETGIQRNAPPSMPKGHASNVYFYGNKGRIGYQHVAKTTLFDMSNYSAGLQPFVRLQKSASTAVASLTVNEIILDYSV